MPDPIREACTDIENALQKLLREARATPSQTAMVTSDMLGMMQSRLVMVRRFVWERTDGPVIPREANNASNKPNPS